MVSPYNSTTPPPVRRGSGSMPRVGVKTMSLIYSERRGARRVAYEVPVAMRIGAQTVKGSSEDISASGVFVRSGAPPPLGQRVSLCFDLPYGRMEVDAVVVRSRFATEDVEPGVGLSFSGLTAIEEAYLAAFCDAVAKVH